ARRHHRRVSPRAVAALLTGRDAFRQAAVRIPERGRPTSLAHKRSRAMRKAPLPFSGGLTCYRRSRIPAHHTAEIFHTRAAAVGSLREGVGMKRLTVISAIVIVVGVAALVYSCSLPMSFKPPPEPPIGSPK